MEYRSPHIRMRDVARIYNALEVGIIITTGSGTIVWGNRYYSQLAQFDIQDYFGRNVREISRREDVVLPTRVMAALGAQRLVLTNAAGGIGPDLAPGDLMLLTDHIASFVPSPLIGPNVDALGPRFPDMTEVYSLRLREKLHAAGKKLGIPLQEGIYLQTTGPQYETPAEIRLYRSLGASAVGMSTACEAIAARHLGLEVCGISCITNLAAGLGGKPLSHQEVQETADQAAQRFQSLVWELLSTIEA